MQARKVGACLDHGGIGALARREGGGAGPLVERKVAALLYVYVVIMI